MAERELTPEEIEAMGLNSPRERELTPEEIAKHGLDAPPRIAPPRVGPGETYLNRVIDVIPLGRSIANVASAGILQAGKAAGLGRSDVRFTDQAKKERREAGLPDFEEEVIPGPVDTYRGVRDERNLRTQAGSDQNKWAGRLGTATGIGLSLFAPLPKVAVGAGAAGRVGSAALTGAGYGGLFGATHGPADLVDGEVGQFAKDVVGVDGLERSADEWKKGNKWRAMLEFFGSGAVGGAGLGGLTAGAVEGARVAEPALRSASIRGGRRVLQGGSDLSAGQKKPLSDEAVEAALREEAIVPFGTTGGAAERLDASTAKYGAEYRRIVETLKARGVVGPDAKRLAEELLKTGSAADLETMNDGVLKAYTEAARKVSEKAPQRPALPDDFPEEMRGLAPGMEPGDLPLDRGLNLTRSAQKEAKKAYKALQDTEVGDAQIDIARTLRLASERAVDRGGVLAGKGSETSRLASEFIPIKQKLGPLIEASEAATRGASKAAQRSSVGIKDMMVGAATGNPFAAAPVAVGSSMAGSRLPSTFASGAYKTAEALRTGTAAPSIAKAASQTVAPVANRPGGVMTSPSLANSFLFALKEDPSELGKYGPVIAKEKTPEAQLAMTQALIQTDPEFAQLFAEMKKRLSSGGSLPEASRGP